MNDIAADQGLIRHESRHPPAVTLQRLKGFLTEAGVKIFATIDFSADAEAVGLALRPELLLIFGNPKAGTPLMVEQPTVGIELPLKVLFWEDADKRSWVAYNDPLYIAQRHVLAHSFTRNLSGVLPLIERACHE